MAIFQRCAYSTDRQRHERGAVLVESAIALVLLILLAGGIVEFASLFASTLDTSSGIRSAARVGSAPTASGPNDDYTILKVALEKVGGRRNDIDKVVIFRADASQKQPPQECTTSATPPSGVACNVYGRENFTQSEEALLASPNAQGWPVASRVPGTDFLGVWVSVNRKSLIPIPGAPTAYNDVFTMKMTNPGTGPGTPGDSISPVVDGGPMSAPVGDNLGWDEDGWLCWDGRGCFDGSSPDSDGTNGGSGGSG